MLKDGFPRLFRLELEQEATIKERGQWSEGSWTWKWNWRWPPRGREIGELENLVQRLDVLQPIRGQADKTEWLLDESRAFKVKRLKEMLDNGGSDSNGNSEPTKWTKIIPKKVCIFIWRVSKDRIPTRVALDRIGIDLDSVLCPRCGESTESMDHALVGCPEVKAVWKMVGRWWRKDLEALQSVQEILHEGTNVGTHGKSKKIWEGVKWSLLFTIWSHRNSIVFKDDKRKIGDLIYEFQRKTFEWITLRCKDLPKDWKGWLVDPVALC